MLFFDGYLSNMTLGRMGCFDCQTDRLLQRGSVKLRHADCGCGLKIWDLMTYLVVVLLSLLVFAAYGDRATTGSLQQLLGSFVLLLLYGAAVIPLGYAYSFGFASPSAAQACCFSF